MNQTFIFHQRNIIICMYYTFNTLSHQKCIIPENGQFLKQRISASWSLFWAQFPRNMSDIYCCVNKDWKVSITSISKSVSHHEFWRNFSLRNKTIWCIVKCKVDMCTIVAANAVKAEANFLYKLYFALLSTLRETIYG